MDYFHQENHDIQFLDEIHYQLKDEYYEQGAEIVSTGEICSSIIFVIKGEIEI